MVIEEGDKLSYALWSMENSPDGVFWADPGGNILYANRTFCLGTGFSEAELLSMNILALDPMVREKDFGPSGRLSFPVRKGDIARLSSLYKHKDGHLIPVEVTMSIPRDDGLVVVCFVRDVTDERAMEARLDQEERSFADERSKLIKEASTDFLTGTWLRRHFFRIAHLRISDAEADGSPLSLLMLDIDKFKEVNDTFGHAAGDAVLVEFCEVMATAIREDDYFIRWGGDEFILLAPGLEPEDACEFGKRLCTLIEAHRFSQPPTLTISVGVAAYRPGESDIGTWVAEADAALLRAKKAGGNRVKRGRRLRKPRAGSLPRSAKDGQNPSEERGRGQEKPRKR